MSKPSYDVWIVTPEEKYQVLSEVSLRAANAFQWSEGRKEIRLSACSEVDIDELKRDPVH